MTSFADKLRQEQMEKCEFHKSENVAYVCIEKKCRDYAKQRYYCIECSQEEGKHDHKPFTIAN